MSAAAPAPATPAPRRQRWLRVLLGLLLLLIALALLVQIMLPPERALRLLLARMEPTLGLRVGFDGDVEYRLRGTPQLVVRNVTVFAPGDDSEPLLVTERALLSLPWSTIRSRGAQFDLTRVELDSPRLHLPTLLRWLDTRPPGDGKVPTISDGVHIRDGRLEGGGWHVEALTLDLPALHAERAIDARVSGTAHVDTLQALFGLRVRADRAVDAHALNALGSLVLLHPSGRLDSVLQLDAARSPDTATPGLVLAPLRLALDARWQPDGNADPLPFVLGLHGDLHAGGDGGGGGDAVRLAPLGLVLRGAGPVPEVIAGGHIAVGELLDVVLDGRLERWPEAWPALPSPLSDDVAPLPFALRYAGPRDASAPVSLRLEHPRAGFVGQVRIAAMLDWLTAPTGGSPLPPLQGRLTADRVEIAGAVLDGVEITIDDGSGDPAP